jgi:autotransporter passenger strand-loop-strand repeat protein
LTVEGGAVVTGPGDLTGVNSVAGQVSGVTIASGGAVELVHGGTANGVTIYDAVASSYSELEIDSGATATGTVVEAGGWEFIRSGGAASGTTVLDGGLEYVFSGGGAVNATVSRGGSEYLLASGAARGTVLSGLHADQFISSGGTATGTTALGGGAEFVSSGGVLDATTLSSGGYAEISSGGAANTTTILSGGLQAVVSGGVALRTIVASGGQEFMFGTAFGETVSSAGSESVASGGLAIGLTVLAGGVVVVDGDLRFDGAGTLAGMLSGSGAVIQTEAGDLVMSDSGAGFSGVAAIRGGTIELATSGALGTGYVEFAEPATGSAVLQIDAADAPAAGGTFANTISNFSGANEDIDLRSIAYVAGATATVVGSTLVLNDGGATYTFNLAGGTAGAYPVLSDGQGGTLIDPAVARFAQTAAAFAPSDAATAALVSSASPIARSPFLHATASAAHL